VKVILPKYNFAKNETIKFDRIQLIILEIKIIIHINLSIYLVF
jgi:hypothetical protein